VNLIAALKLEAAILKREPFANVELRRECWLPNVDVVDGVFTRDDVLAEDWSVIVRKPEAAK